MYTVIRQFFDLQDDNHAYKVGDKFPHNGAIISEERIEELKGNKNKLKTPLIMEKKQKKKKGEKDA
jgi:hypothetical protein